MEKLSVIIPAYNAEKYLAEAVESVRKQNWTDEIEIIIIDDGSEDNTLSVAERLGDFAISKERGGAASARNLGVQQATGEMIFFLDADDSVMPGAFDNLYKPFLNQEEIMAVFSKAEDFLSPELTEAQKKSLITRKEPYGGVLPGCAFIRKKVFEKVGLFDEKLRAGETVAWQMALRDAQIPVTTVDFVTILRRLHLSNTGRVNKEQEMRDYAAIMRRRMKRK